MSGASSSITAINLTVLFFILLKLKYKLQLCLGVLCLLGWSESWSIAPDRPRPLTIYLRVDFPDFSALIFLDFN